MFVGFVASDAYERAIEAALVFDGGLRFHENPPVAYPIRSVLPGDLSLFF